jgi:hypothetical protein
VLSAAEEVAQAPDDEDARASFRLQLRKLLEEFPELAAELEPQAERLRANVQVIVGGNRAIGFEGGMHGGAILSGDVHVGSVEKKGP